MTAARTSPTRLIFLVGFLALGSLAAHAEETPAQDDRLKAAIAGDHRSEENRARDTYRHPYETLTFFGIRPDMTVVEIYPGRGWYSEILAPYLKGSGTFYAAQRPSDPSYAPGQRSLEAFDQKVKDAPEIYGERTGRLGRPRPHLPQPA